MSSVAATWNVNDGSEPPPHSACVQVPSAFVAACLTSSTLIPRSRDPPSTLTGMHPDGHDSACPTVAQPCTSRAHSPLVTSHVVVRQYAKACSLTPSAAITTEANLATQAHRAPSPKRGQSADAMFATILTVPLGQD